MWQQACFGFAAASGGGQRGGFVMPRIAWIEDADAQGDLLAIFEHFRQIWGRAIPDLYRAMGWRPDFFVPVREASRRLQEADGALSRAQHAMIRLYVPALNRCQHCTADHAYRME